MKKATPDDFYRVTDYNSGSVFATGITYQHALDICVTLRQKFSKSDQRVEHVKGKTITLIH